MTAQRFDVMIIGGGILGLATGYKYLLSHPGKSLALLEREPGPAHHQTGRNSEYYIRAFTTHLVL